MLHGVHSVGMSIRISSARSGRHTALLLIAVLGSTAAVSAPWAWPTAPPHHIEAGFVAPLTPYSAGHRGIDLLTVTGTPVLAPADGVISFVGVVADRPVISISQSGGVVSSLEPVQALVASGDQVVKGQQIGVTAAGGHCANVCLHFGVRKHGFYVSPLNYLGGVERAVLLPLP